MLEREAVTVETCEADGTDGTNYERYLGTVFPRIYSGTMS